METQCSRSSLESMGMILVRITSTLKDEESEADTACSQARLPIVGLGGIKLSCWPRRLMLRKKVTLCTPRAGPYC